MLFGPDQVSGYFHTYHDIPISHEAIYRYIYAAKKRHLMLKPFMRHGAKKRDKAYGSGHRASKTPNRICITERPLVIEDKIRLCKPHMQKLTLHTLTHPGKGQLMKIRTVYFDNFSLRKLAVQKQLGGKSKRLSKT